MRSRFDPQQWQRRGLLLRPSPSIPWMQSHAALPTLLQNGDGTCQIFFSARGSGPESRIGRAVGNLSDPQSFTIDPEPVLMQGELGAFDDCSVYPSGILREGGRIRLYYIGRTQGASVPFHSFIGLAESTDDGRTFRRVSRSPIVDRTDAEPFMCGSPFVLAESGRLRMWYANCVRWDRLPDGTVRHFYHIRHAESVDGVYWKRDGTVCIDFASPDEYAIARPFVVREDGRYKMWFCARGEQYRMGYAESDDGLTWQRDDAAVIDLQGDGGAACYPCIVDHGGKRLMLYNGAGYGRAGIELAELLPAA